MLQGYRPFVIPANPNPARIGTCSSYFPVAFDPFEATDVNIWQIGQTDPQLAACLNPYGQPELDASPVYFSQVPGLLV